MINAFKQIRLSNGVLISGFDGRVSVANSGSLAFSSELESLNSDFQFYQSGTDLSIGELQSGLGQAVSDISGLYYSVDTLQSGVDLAFSGIGELADRFDILESGVNENTIAFADSLDAISGSVDLLSGSLEITNTTLSGVSAITTALSSGLSDILDTLTIQSGDIDNLKSGLNGTLEVLVSHQDRLSGIDSAIFDLYSNLGGQDNNTQTFSYPIPMGSEDLTVLFPSGAFLSIPKVHVTLESEVGYMFALRAKTVSGFGISFSDVIQENDVSIDVTATVQS